MRLSVRILAIVAFAFAGSAAGIEHGIQRAAMDLSVRPGDDFNLYANGGWLKAAVVPPDQGSLGAFTILRDKAVERTAALIGDVAKEQAPPGSDERKIADFYASFLDVAAIDGNGLAPLRSRITALESIPDKSRLARALGQSVRADVDALNNTNFFTENLFGLWVAPAFNDPDRYAGYLLPVGLGLPDRSYYVDEGPQGAAVLAAYAAHVANTFMLAGLADAEARAQAVVALEVQIARNEAARADNADVLKADNLWHRADFQAAAPGLDWDAFLDGAGLSNVSSLYVWQPGALEGISDAVLHAPLSVWRDYLVFHLLNRFAAVLPKAFDDERFGFYGITMAGTAQQQPRWRRAVYATNAALGWAVGRLYVARYFPPARKLQIEAMVDDIKAAFGRRIDALAWMSGRTKAKAKAKLAALTVGIGYPAAWRDYSKLEIVRGDAFGNQDRAERFDYARNVALIGTPVDRATWCMTPQTVNAVNLPLQNALNVPAAILEPPFFDAEADSAFNYGAIGSIIGHEISHNFDDQGSRFDANGRLADWWSAADLAHFRAEARRLADQYSTYAPLPDLHVDGRQTLSENIADVAGLSAAFDAWRASLNGKAAPVIGGLSGAQRFFIAYAQTRQNAFREPTLRLLLMTDGHAPGMIRAQAVRNIDAWYDAFGVTPDAKLYLDPAQRVRVW